MFCFNTHRIKKSLKRATGAAVAGALLRITKYTWRRAKDDETPV